MVATHKDKNKTTVNPSTDDYAEQTPGGPRDRLDWLIGQVPGYSHRAFKVLAVLTKRANKVGICWPSWACLNG